MDANTQSQAVDRIKEAEHVLITVSANPTVDQLSAAIGLTLLLNKLHKHATAVFSGKIPSTLEFLQPEETLETNTDSLQDFIVSLDKTKADKLRYKVEDDVVRIFITPYRTSLSEADLNFSQGDFNVDVVVALGVDNRDHLDEAIMQHGRILHDATVISLMAGESISEVGSINWQDQNASSLCEMLTSVSDSFGPSLIDEQIATAFLTGIVATTDRFRNDRTTPRVMTMSAQLMAAGANQQLIAEELATPTSMQSISSEEAQAQQKGYDVNNGVLSLRHDHDKDLEHSVSFRSDNRGAKDTIAIDNNGSLTNKTPNDNANQPNQKTQETVLQAPTDSLVALANNGLAQDNQQLPSIDNYESLPKVSTPSLTATSTSSDDVTEEEPTLPQEPKVGQQPYEVPAISPLIEPPQVTTEPGVVLEPPIEQPQGLDNASKLSDVESALPEVKPPSQEHYSKFVTEPPRAGGALNSTVSAQEQNYEDQETVLSPTEKESTSNNANSSTTSPLLSTQDDSESVAAPSVPSTPSSQLSDDAESKPSPLYSPLGAPVSDKDTLETIDKKVEAFEATTVNQQDAVEEALARVKQIQEESASKGDEYPTPNQNIGANFVPLDSDPLKEDALPKFDPQTGQQLPAPTETAPPPVPPPLPQDGTFPLPPPQQ
ncbi:MAG: hypothetical protein QG645_472 [Patescibacteria group bacterium]|nr:hypothetical protein [Patescibacteria group bacterium]MDQ5953564.1 hypothetical protein [Patescibacteria group bacterium]